MAIDDFGLQVLYAVYRYRVSATYEAEPETFDTDVWDIGRSLFGDGWGGDKRDMVNQAYAYCPAIAMKLGRLAGEGLVDKVPSIGEGYSTWEMNDAGYALLIDRYLIEADDIPED